MPAVFITDPCKQDQCGNCRLGACGHRCHHDRARQISTSMRAYIPAGTRLSTRWAGGGWDITMPQPAARQLWLAGIGRDRISSHLTQDLATPVEVTHVRVTRRSTIITVRPAP